MQLDMIDAINERLEALIYTCDNEALREAMLYSAMGAGKRIRPRLLLAACEGARGSYDETALDFACCLEMLHAYSLVHDDLPAMDNDDLRRGKPTAHKQFGEAMAILAGDALLNHAFEMMADLCVKFFRSRRPASAMQIIARAAGVNGMITGQVLDLANEGKQTDIETLKNIHRHKTSALIAAAVEAGALLGGGTRKLIYHTARLGKNLGLAFQVQDDMLDVTATAETLGKQPFSDKKNEKATYISVLGLEKTQEIYQQLAQDVRTMAHDLPSKTPALCNLVDEILNREK
jgi:geranylgeranyl diphosphate synthase type II